MTASQVPSCSTLRSLHSSTRSLRLAVLSQFHDLSVVSHMSVNHRPRPRTQVAHTRASCWPRCLTIEQWPPCSLGLVWPDGSCHRQVDEGRNAKIAAFPLLTYRSRCIAMLARFSCDACLAMLRDCLMSRLLAFRLRRDLLCGSSCLSQFTLAPVVRPSMPAALSSPTLAAPSVSASPIRACLCAAARA